MEDGAEGMDSRGARERGELARGNGGCFCGEILTARRIDGTPQNDSHPHSGLPPSRGKGL